MAVHRIFDHIYEASFSLIAIHSPLEDYQLAYFINKTIASKFKKAKTNIDFNDCISYSIYEWENCKEDELWTLIPNATQSSEKSVIEAGLFENDETRIIHYLIPEHKNVDYFLKIDNDDMAIQTNVIIGKLNDISQIATAYALNPNQLKSKNNLIF